MQTTRHTCRTAVQPSRTSPTLTKCGVVWFPGICGSWLASDADNSAYLPDRGAAIAGKPDSHKGWSGVVPRYLWELARQRCRQLYMPAGLRCCHRGQPDSHKVWSGVAPRYLWELACQRCRQLGIPAVPGRCHRGQARLSHKGDLWELACQRCRQLDTPAGPRCSHRGQARLPQRVEWCGSPVPVGAGLPAMQTTRHTCRSAVQPSRASPALTKGDLWELACQRCRQLGVLAGAQCSHRGQARLPQKVIGVGCCLRGI